MTPDPSQSPPSKPKRLGDRIAEWVNGRTPKQAIWAALGAIVILALAHLILVALLTGTLPWNAWPVELGKLGAYGDSVAPWTAGFALLAALFAGLAFREQRDALNVERETARQERAHANLARFDTLAAQALTIYDDAFTRLDHAAQKAHRTRTAQSLLKDLRLRRFRGDLDPLTKEETSRYWRHVLGQKKYQPIQRFAKTVFALIVWLDDVTSNTELIEKPSTRRWVRLLVSRMSGPERHMLMELIEFTADPEVQEAERHLGMFDWQALHTYTEPQDKVSTRPLTGVPQSVLRVAPELESLYTWRAGGGEGATDLDSPSPVIVRPDGRHLIVVSGLTSYIQQQSNALIRVLRAADATAADYGEAEKKALTDDVDPFVVPGAVDDSIDRVLTSQVPGWVESAWLIGSRPGLRYTRHLLHNSDDGDYDVLVFVKPGFFKDPLGRRSLTQPVPHVDLFFHEVGTPDVVRLNGRSFPFAPLGWHELNEIYAEYSPSKAINQDKPKRARAFRLWPRAT